MLRSSSKHSKVFWNALSCFEIRSRFWSTLKYFEVAWNTLKYVEALWNILKCLEVSRNTLKCFGVAWSTLTQFDIFWNALKYFEILWNTQRSQVPNIHLPGGCHVAAIPWVWFLSANAATLRQKVWSETRHLVRSTKLCSHHLDGNSKLGE